MSNAIASAPSRATEQTDSPTAGLVAMAADVTDGGYTRAQLIEVLEHLAGRASTLSRLLMCVQSQATLEWEVTVMVDAAQTMANDIGATADRMSGSMICGDIDHWTFGPNFAALGKAGAA